MTDWALPKAGYGLYDSIPEFSLTPVQGEFGLFGIYFNGASSTWGNWGCNWSGSPGHLYDSTCGIEMRQAFAHLVNRGDFAHNNVVASPAVGLADDTPPAKGGATATPFATQCSWDQSVMVAFGTACYSHWSGNEPGAYTITGSGTCVSGTPGTLSQVCNAGQGFPVIGSPDFCAAAIHMINAGIASGKNPSTCVLTGVNAGVASHPFRMMTRVTNPRLTLGQQFASEINNLFGSTVVLMTIGAIPQLGPIVFFDESGRVDDWDAYTYGYSEGGPFAGDALFTLYHSQFSGGAGPCAGATGADEPSNPTFVCDAQTDALTASQAYSPDIATYNNRTLAVMNRLGQIANDLVTYSPGLRIAALTSVAGLVNARGSMYNDPFTLLNAHQNLAYTPSNPLYRFGGGDPTVLRYGQASGTYLLNIFDAQYVWEFQAIGQIYDPLFSANPVSPSDIICWMCNSYSVSVDSQGNTHFHVQLRQNLRWHDGLPVDSKDVAFSVLAYNDLAPRAGGSLGSIIMSVKVLSNSRLDIVMNGQSIFYPIELESPIFPRHLWECDLVPENDCASGDSLIVASGGSVQAYTSNGFNVPSAARASPSFDPLVHNALIGSGPFECRSLFQLGIIGGGCVINPDGSQGGQAIPPGGKMVLSAFDNTASSADPFNQYMRSFNPAWGTGSGVTAESGQFQEFSYADQDKSGSVTLFDLASVAACFGASGPTATCSASNYSYWQRSAFETTPGTISREAAIVAAHYGDTYVSPFAWNSVSLENIVSYP